jgi:phosphatidylglycerophosphate synthase
MTTRRIWLTRANGLTLLRLLFAPALAITILSGDAVAATVLFWLAVATDVADGRVARRFGEVSAHGRVIDHAADATFVSAGAAALAYTGALPVALAPLIAVAFLQYAAGSRFHSSREPRASRLGRWNGIAYYVVVAVPIIRDALRLSWPEPAWVEAFGWLLVATTLASIVSRLGFSAPAE